MKNVLYPYIVTIIIFWFHATSTADRGRSVTTKLGTIRGLEADDGDYTMFMGIPYARVNESNPFGDAIPNPVFETILEAYDDSIICPQKEEFNQTISGILQCLTLNVYVPNSITPENKLPVLVHIFGGNFKMGFGGRFNHGPTFLVKHDIILVTLNYRVGPYGFFCLDTPHVSGNQGLKDQIVALRWVRDNIEEFGGDAKKITVSGHSSGAIGLDLLLYSITPNEGLFDQVILQSGTSYFPDVTKHTNNTQLFVMARQLGLETDDVEEALTFLSTLDTNSVVASSIETDIVFKCCIEKQFEDVDHIVTDYPINLKIPAVENISIMIGNTDNERVYMYEKRKPEYLDNIQVFKEDLNDTFAFINDDLNIAEAIVRQYYIGDAKVDERVKDEIITFSSDFHYYHPIKKNLLKYIDNGAKDVFYYMFSYNGGRNYLKDRFKITKHGASHADELGYLYNISYMERSPPPNDQLMIDRMTTLWTNFVKFGNPTPETTELLPVKWEPLTKQSLNYLQIDTELNMKTRLFPERMAFWDMFYELYGKFENGYRTEDQLDSF